MKKYAIALMLSLLLATATFSQEDWYWQRPIPQGNELNDLWIFNEDTIIAVGIVGTIIKTTDGGATWWVSHYSGGINSDLYCIFFASPDTGWAAGNGGKILKTTSNGRSWTARTIMDSLTINGLFFHNTQSGWAVGTKVQLGVQKGVILKTTDGGASWTIDENTDANSLNTITFADSKVGWAMGSRYKKPEDIILRTEDGGVTWAPLFTGKTTEIYSACFINNLRGWAVGKDANSLGKIIYTENSGDTWEIQNPLVTKVLWSITFRDLNSGWAVGEGGSILKTINGGKDWIEITSITLERHLKAIGFTKSQMMMSVGNAGVIIKSTDDGSVWEEISTGRSADPFFAVDFTDSDTGWIVGPNKTILKSVDGGANWMRQISTVQQNLLDVWMLNHMTGWIVGEKGVILKTTDGGKNWIEQTSGTSCFLHSSFFLNDQIGWLCGGPVTGDSSIILYTSDGGNQWTKQIYREDASLRAIYFVGDQNGWAVGENGNVVHTLDGGKNWNPVSLGRSDDFYSVFFLSNNIGWIGGKSILFTANGGESWEEQIAFAFNDQVRAIKFIDMSIGWAVTQGSVGALYKTMDGGKSWLKMKTGSANNLYDIDIVYDQVAWVVGTYSTILKTDAVFVPVELTSFEGKWIDGHVELSWVTASELNNYGFEIQRKFAEKDGWKKVGFVDGHGTTAEMSYYSFADNPEGGGKYSYRLKQLDFDGKFKYSPIREVQVPTKFALYQNHPNPFNPETLIGFELPVNSHVKLEIYNMLGQKITVLIDERRPAGFQQIVWEGTDGFGRPVGSGVYFCRIKAGSFEATKKAVLLR